MTLCSKCKTYPAEFNVPYDSCHPCWMRWLLTNDPPTPKPKHTYFFPKREILQKKKAKKKEMPAEEKQLILADLYVESALYDLGLDASKEEIVDHIVKISHNQIPLQQVKLTVLKRLKDAETK